MECRVNKPEYREQGTIGAWAKRFHFASRAVMESVLRPYDLGSTQWYVLYHLAIDGPTVQRDLARALQIEAPTLSGIVATLVRKGLVDQLPDPGDQRQRKLQLTLSGQRLWDELPDPIALARSIAFDGVDAAEIETAMQVLQAATLRLTNHL